MDNRPSNSEIEYLAEKYRMGNLSQDEQAKFDQWYAGFEDSTFVHSGAEDPLAVRERIYNALSERIDGTDQPRRIGLWPQLAPGWFRGIAVAASIAIAVMTGGYFLYQSQTDKDKTKLAMANDIAPGKNGATLTLANGKKIYINDVLAGNIADESGVRISKNKDGQITYEVIGDDTGTLTYNTLTTTRGEQTKVRLPDGTLVFLNAGSSLKYPNNFSNSKNRTVSLTGEGYFEVSKEKARPFIVESRLQSVEVLGTHFNIKAYEDGNAVKTTLLEGSVRTSNNVTNSSTLLRPGQQSRVTNAFTEVADVEVEDAVAWKNGRIMYDGETLENIMKDIARWYNVEVVFRNDAIRKEIFFVSVSRWDNVSKLLKIMEKSQDIVFEIKGNKIFVDAKQN